MEILGKVVRLGNLSEGTSARGAWKKQELIIETLEQYPKNVCLVCWGDRVIEAQNFTPGQIIKAQISIESREFNGKWYTDVRPFRFETENSQAQNFNAATVQSNAQQTVPQNSDYTQMPSIDYYESDNGDDLPF
ncbi:MAG: DUF3127 domain-containing protein [Lentimicrobiaceae bacterium]|nr:DUF3127 domain-containing protein [Lentimicrobiaceae bacterium]